MDYERLFTVADNARSGRKLSSDDRSFIAKTIPNALADYPRVTLPKSVRHPAGFSISGAPVGTFVNSALLLAARKVLGNRYTGSEFYEGAEQKLAFGIMRSHFHKGYPKGAFCCLQCTLAVYPVLEAGAIRYFDCRHLARDVRQLIDEGGWRFVSAPNPKMLRWALAN